MVDTPQTTFGNAIEALDSSIRLVDRWVVNGRWRRNEHDDRMDAFMQGAHAGEISHTRPLHCPHPVGSEWAFEWVRGMDLQQRITEACRTAFAAGQASRDDEVANLRSLLVEYTDWQGPDVGIIKPIKPGHGPCCTCQTCGRPHDWECVCEHNDIAKALETNE